MWLTLRKAAMWAGLLLSILSLSSIASFTWSYRRSRGETTHGVDGRGFNFPCNNYGAQETDKETRTERPRDRQTKTAERDSEREIETKH